MTAEAFKERTGKVSITRLIFASVIVLIVLTWAIVSIKTWTVQPFSPGMVGVISALIVGKVWQKKIENKAIVDESKTSSQ